MTQPKNVYEKVGRGQLVHFDLFRRYFRDYPTCSSGTVDCYSKWRSRNRVCTREGNKEFTRVKENEGGDKGELVDSLSLSYDW